MTPNVIINVLIKSTKIIGLTRKEVLKKVGYSPAVVSEWYLRRRYPTFVQVIDWADALGYDIVIIRKDQCVPTITPDA